MGQENNTIKKRKWKQLTEKERYQIEGFYRKGLSPKEIGEALEPKRDRRTIMREITLGLTLQRDSELREKHVYLADAAQRKHDENASNKGKGLKIGNDHKLANHIEMQIKKHGWSPDAVLGRIKEEGLEFETSICTKTLYNYIDSGVFMGISNKDLLYKKTAKKRTYKKIRKVALNNKNGKSIDDRPDAANRRKEAGHWEIDLVVGKKGTKPAILTLVERKSRKSIYVLTKNKTQKEIIAALKRVKRRVGGNFDAVFKTITADNGVEFLDNIGMKKALKCDEIYYAHPYSSWERGSNENGNGILRRFIPKGTDINTVSAKQLQQYEDWVNNYPRKIFGYKTANEMAL
jgi:IS30 family transposase